MEASTPSGLTIVGQSARSIADVTTTTASPLVSSLATPLPTVQPWAGWPGDWLPPLWGQQGGGMSGQYVSTVYTCTDLNSRQLATFPVYRMRGTDHLEDLPWMVNPAPELYADWSDFMKQLANTQWLRGESIIYALARYDGGTGPVARMMVLNPDLVNIEWSHGEVVYEVGGRRLPREDICHVRYQSWPGALRGVSPIQWVARNLIGADAMEHYQAELAAGGGVPWAVLTAPGNLTAEQSAENRERWLEASRTRRTAPVMLSGGLRLDTLTLSPADMALLDLRVFDEQRICAAFGVPPYLVGLPQSEGLTYANASSLFDYHWRATLRPMARHIAAALSEWALPLGQRIEFNADEYVRGDLPARAQAYAVLHGIFDEETGQRAMSIAEIRQAERLATIPPDPTSTAALTGPAGPVTAS